MYVYTPSGDGWPARCLNFGKDLQVTQSTTATAVRRRTSPTRRPVRAIGAALLALALAACGGGQPAAPGPGAAAPPPPEVGVITVVTQTAPLSTELPGRVEASRVAQVRARVTGIVQKRLFREGSEVKAGQLLFQIDPAPYQAAVDSAKATLAKTQANTVQATEQAKRFKPLNDAKAISQQEYVNAQAAQAQAEADVAAARAALQAAQLNLGYASVTAPISGRIGRALVTEGALVSATEATQLALIQQIDPVYVNSTQAVADVARLRKRAASGATAADLASVRIVLEDGSELPQRGRLMFADLSVDPTSAQVTLRTEVANPQAQLLPGMYVRTRLVQGQIAGAVLVPQQAVTRGPQGDTVLVVGEGGKPAMRTVSIGGAAGSNWIVQDGLKPGEQVIVEGFQKMRPGAPVKPVPWAGSVAATPGAAAPAASATPSAPPSASAPAAAASR
jgi:membrane fusion protein, multidrug efflux system